MATLGRTSAGNSSDYLGSGAIWMSKFTAGATFIPATAYFNTTVAGTANARVAIWEDNAGAPGALVASSFMLPTSVSGWNSVSIATFARKIYNGQSYWIGLYSGYSGNFYVPLNSSGGTSRYYSNPGGIYDPASGSYSSSGVEIPVYVEGVDGTAAAIYGAYSGTKTGPNVGYGILGASPYTPSQDITVDRLGADTAFHPDGTKGRLGIYSDSSGSPGSKLRETAEITAYRGWCEGSITSIVLTAGTQYWFTGWFDGNASMMARTGGAGNKLNNTTFYSATGLPATWGSPTSTSGDVLAYFAAGAGTADVPVSESIPTRYLTASRGQVFVELTLAAYFVPTGTSIVGDHTVVEDSSTGEHKVVATGFIPDDTSRMDMLFDVELFDNTHDWIKVVIGDQWGFVNLRTGVIGDHSAGFQLNWVS